MSAPQRDTGDVVDVDRIQADENGFEPIDRIVTHHHSYDANDDLLEHELERDASSFVDIMHLTAADGAVAGEGSTVTAAILNFTNCIIGAGAIGLGGAVAESGGILSVLCIVFFAVLVKQSLDLVIQLSLQQRVTSYEVLAAKAFGRSGKYLVMVAKFAYAFGCLVAYIVVVQDNFGPAVKSLVFGTSSGAASKSFLHWFLGEKMLVTWVLSTTVILPLCLLRDMTPFAFASVISVIAMASIVAIVIYLWWMGVGEGCNDFEKSTSRLLTETSTASKLTATSFYKSDLYRHWFKIRWIGFLNNMGTFVFTFVCQHTVHLTFGSLKPEYQTLQDWKRISSVAIALSCLVSLVVAVFVYMTFWENTKSDIFQIYPDTTVVDLAKLLLSITMMLTFPLPFFTCRELVIVVFFTESTRCDHGREQENPELEEPLMGTRRNEDLEGDEIEIGCSDAVVETNALETYAALAGSRVESESSLAATNPLDTYAVLARRETPPGRGLRRFESAESTSLSLDLSVLSSAARQVLDSILLPDDPRQLKLPYHIGLTSKLWFAATGLAIAAPNLGDVLDLVGCFSGTVIAFILPGSIAWKLQGYSTTAAIILIVGGVVGVIGTSCSLKKFVHDTFHAS
jgi:amino acid permease